MRLESRGVAVPTIWDDLFENYGHKTVSSTDKSRSAYVLTAAQRDALTAAGMAPSEERPARPFTVNVLFEPSRPTLQASYYLSMRSEEAEREPEPRLGREIISSWMNVGDEVIIGNIGSQIFVAKAAAARAGAEVVGQQIAKDVNPKTVLRRARRAKGKPATAVKTSTVFIRNPYVVAGALVRSHGACEMPGCTIPLFRRADGTSFLEVHHVVPLAEGGDDTLVNAAALCPMCHRELHFGARKMKKRKALAAKISNAS
ncbi:MAG TPA: HNH endonuclease signature motif containing protein [Allosphingosinicella sp.]|nr:HNH endonuclease signature motif containing protein [Allosphingosinicella sp.]